MSIEYYCKTTKKLNSQKLYSSAEHIALFGLSKYPDNPELLLSLGRALYGQKEYLHARVKLKLALSKQTAKTKFKPNLTPSTPIRGSVEIDTEIKNLLIKICTKLNLDEEVKTIIQGIPANYRTLDHWLAFAHSLKKLGKKKDALYAYGIVLKENPAAVEAALNILELGGQLPTLKNALMSKQVHELEWYSPLCVAYANQVAGKSSVALNNYEQIEKNGYLDNQVLLELEGKTYIQNQDAKNALKKLKKLRDINPDNLRFVDVYCSVLTANQEMDELEKVVTELISLPSKSVPVWTALAIYSESKGKRNNAFNFIQNAIQINPHHSFARLFRGTLFLSLNKPSEALKEFLTSYHIKKELNSFAGIVRSLIAQQKIKEALVYAKEARKLLPESASALTLVGLVLAQPQVLDLSVRKKARECFDAALKMDPTSLETILAICNLNAWEGKVDEAIEALLKFSKTNPRDAIYARLADFYQIQSKFPQAFEYYLKALSLNPHCDTAKEGINRLTKALKPKKDSSHPGVDEFEEEEEEYEIVEAEEELEEGEEVD